MQHCQENAGVVSPIAETVCWPAQRILVGAAASLGRAVKSSGDKLVGVGVGC